MVLTQFNLHYLSNAAGGGFLILKDGTILSVYPDAEETERLLKKHLE